MPMLLSCFLESKWWHCFCFIDSFLLCLLVVLSSLLKVTVAACGFVLALLQPVWPFCSSRNFLILLVWIGTQVQHGELSEELLLPAWLQNHASWAFSALLAKQDPHCSSLGCSPAGWCLLVTPDCSFSALFVPTQVAVPCCSSLRPLCQKAAKHVLACHFLQVEKGWKWQ